MIHEAYDDVEQFKEEVCYDFFDESFYHEFIDNVYSCFTIFKW